MSDILKIDFQILGGAILPEVITSRLGLVPDVAMLAGGRDSVRKLPRQNTWALSSSVDSDDVLEHWNELGEKLVSVKDQIRDISRDCKIRITIAISSKGRIPSIIIPWDMAEFCGYVQADIDIDHLQW
ncbi:DUF4279 domain-containing protein [Silvimonas amylolytica]|uniref:DUF4279 domain-containing protein n=1 Tax=Silvimonas amylolytica TaxID=449663 RepID=A0ABQ2PTS0_9NEIS|nr:DUF4279 domain-containing protein [Silvimonas amylolytica]GGP28319.1 hypothetical protein GCM10010971_41380 [Silvimonas amylolytica]